MLRAVLCRGGVVQQFAGFVCLPVTTVCSLSGVGSLQLVLAAAAACLDAVALKQSDSIAFHHHTMLMQQSALDITLCGCAKVSRA